MTRGSALQTDCFFVILSEAKNLKSMESIIQAIEVFALVTGIVYVVLHCNSFLLFDSSSFILPLPIHLFVILHIFT